MFDFAGVLGLAIGLVLVFFLLSLICSGLLEAIEVFARRRALYLEAAIADLLGEIGRASCRERV